MLDNAITETIDQLLATQRQQSRRLYDQAINRDLAQQQAQALMQRNVSLVLNQLFSETLNSLKTCWSQAGASEAEISLLISHLDQAYEALINELLLYILDKHRSSCAISNFPEEHAPSQEYLSMVGQQIKRDWEAFSQQLSQSLCA